MNIRKIPAFVLAIALQILPLCRVACVNQAVAPTGFAVVVRWMTAAVALLGSYHAIAGASASISGISLWTQVTNGAPAGPVCPPANATGTVGKPLVYFIVLANPGTMNQQMDYYNYNVLPPGLTMNTNVGGADGLGGGFITGTPSQAGSYTVTLLAGNLNWPQTVTLTLPITISGGSGPTPPGISVPPVNQTVTAGANVSFNVTASGTAPLSYSWKFDTVPIPGATTSSLQLKNVQTTNSGTYSVTVTNSAGSANASATLTVNAAAIGPSIITPPVSLTVSNGASASFSVTADGTAPFNYQWRKGTSTIPAATNSVYSIAAVTTNDAAGYSVVITNSVGSITSSVATLTVLLPPSTRPFQLANVLATTGSVAFDVNGPAQTNYVIWSSTDLAHWTAIKTNFTATGTVHFTNSSTAALVEFYKASISP